MGSMLRVVQKILKCCTGISVQEKELIIYLQLLFGIGGMLFLVGVSRVCSFKLMMLQMLMLVKLVVVIKLLYLVMILAMLQYSNILFWNTNLKNMINTWLTVHMLLMLGGLKTILNFSVSEVAI